MARTIDWQKCLDTKTWEDRYSGQMEEVKRMSYRRLDGLIDELKERDMLLWELYFDEGFTKEIATEWIIVLEAEFKTRPEMFIVETIVTYDNRRSRPQESGIDVCEDARFWELRG